MSPPLPHTLLQLSLHLHYLHSSSRQDSEAFAQANVLDVIIQRTMAAAKQAEAEAEAGAGAGACLCLAPQAAMLGKACSKSETAMTTYGGS
jgi:hypothetical protein